MSEINQQSTPAKNKNRKVSEKIIRDALKKEKEEALLRHPPPQHQEQQPGHESIMVPQPRAQSSDYQASNKLRGKVAIITGGDSGIGRAVAILYAKEGADIMLCYLNEHEDAMCTCEEVLKQGVRCSTFSGDIGDETTCQEIVKKTMDELGRLDIVINNAGEQHPVNGIEDITAEQLQKTFRTNIFSYFYLIKAALPYLQRGGAIVNTTSVTAFKGQPQLIDYSATKGAIVALTRSLALSLADRDIKVNAVAPGPIWTPLIPASFSAETVGEFGQDVPLHRPGQPAEVAPCYVFLACADSSYMTGQVLHPNGGTIVDG